MKTRSCYAEGLDLRANDTILYKFFLGSRSLVPQGIREVAGEADSKADLRHARQAREAGLKREAERDTVRPGRVDTGLAVYQNVERVRIASLRSILSRKGFWLADAHFFQKPALNRKEGQCVIVLLLSATSEGAIKLPNKVIEGLRKLARENVWTMHVWDNSNLGNPATVNFTGRQQGEPEYTLICRDDFLRLGTPDGRDALEVERAEDELVARDLLEELVEL